MVGCWPYVQMIRLPCTLWHPARLVSSLILHTSTFGFLSPSHFGLSLSYLLQITASPLYPTAHLGIPPSFRGGGGMGKTVKCARKRMGDAKMYWGNKGDMPNSAGGGVQVT